MQNHEIPVFNTRIPNALYLDFCIKKGYFAGFHMNYTPTTGSKPAPTETDVLRARGHPPESAY